MTLASEPWPVGQLAPSLAAACARWADRPALTSPAGTMTYAELGRTAARLTASYRRLGIRPGDRVVCQLPNWPEHVLAVNAAWSSGAVHVGTDSDLTGPELAWVVERTEAAALVFSPRAGSTDPLAPVRAVRRARPATKVIMAGDGVGGDVPLADLLVGGNGEGGDWAPRRPPDDTAHLLLTSGTTGHPKAVRETLPACWAKMQFFADAYGPRTDDVMLLHLPVAHVFGLRLAMLALLSGGRLVLADRFSPAGALGAVASEGVTVLPGMPAHFTLLLGALDPGRHAISSLRWAISAASRLPGPLVDQIYDRLGVDLLYVYGCSENFTVLSTDREEIAAGSVGRTVFRGPAGSPPDGTIGVLDPETGKELPAGTVGELAFGAAHPVRYWKAPDAATDGWYRTGDLGRVDPDGLVYVLGRLKELINRGGLHVSPTEVETAVARHPAVADSAVVGTPDPVLGEAICACVVAGAQPVPTLEDVRTFLGATLARHKLPDELCEVDVIPRTKIGKVDRPALVRMVVAGGRPRQYWRPR
jgi:acyl-CoA synthetase (AMP-forming)/AMP-acid ligase II